MGALLKTIGRTRDSIDYFEKAIKINPDFANDRAVGRPILPIPITQTDISLDSINFLISFTSSEKIPSLFITFIKNSNLYSLHCEIIKESV